MMKVAVNEPDLCGNEKKYLDECVDTGWISSEGPFVERFEREMALVCGRKHGIAVSNGSAALDAALLSLSLPEGSEVIMPAFTIISCASAILRAGCVPVLVDCGNRTWNMDTDQIESKITSKTRAIMAVHIYGLPTDMRPVAQIAQRYGLKVIEDAAEAIGQTCYERSCGSWGDISCFSFYPNKHVTTGEGGMILCDDDELADRCRSMRNLCFIPERRFVHYELGYNFRMSNLQAALGVAQLEKLDETVKKKRHIGAKYQRLFSGLAGLELPLHKTEYAENIYWVFGLVLGDEISIDAREFTKRLGPLGVGTRPFFWPMHEQPVLLDRGLFGGERYPAAERIARRGFYIPSGVALTDEQMEYVACQVASVLEVS
ncbi:MAG: DegT/DnrJ/EryC1/StrS family aminotransferase [Synergistaceae bacterium]|jgi:perosamine synthetase|nr:DegT/DnrJ/EryC1/StrS family aminotransferase [Synergistaceae bacterium]